MAVALFQAILDEIFGSRTINDMTSIQTSRSLLTKCLQNFRRSNVEKFIRQKNWNHVRGSTLHVTSGPLDHELFRSFFSFPARQWKFMTGNRVPQRYDSQAQMRQAFLRCRVGAFVNMKF